MKLEPAVVSSVNGYDVINSDGVFTLHEIDERDGLRQVGPSFGTFEAAAEYAVALPEFLQAQAAEGKPSQ